MAHYLLIETAHPRDGGEYGFELGEQLVKGKHQVTLFLLQDGVFAVRQGFLEGQRLLQKAQAAGISVLAESVCLRERGITSERPASRVREGNMEELVDLLMERCDKVIWH